LEQSRLQLFRMRHKLKAPPDNDWLISLHRHLPLQISFQPSNRAWRVVVLFACVNLSPLLFPARLSCDPYASTWVSGQKSSLRLIAAGGPLLGFYRVGIEIRLDPGALTYWRMPGGAGVPPVFSFEGSANADGIAVSYPAPMRMDEDGTEAFGYRGSVMFPLHVTPKDATRPVLLVVNLSYAVCARICLPAKAEARLSLDPNQEASDASKGATAIAAAEAEVPLRLTPQQRDTKVAINRDKTAPLPTWRLSTQSNVQDLFAEAPPGWYFETRKSGRPDEFLIVAVEEPQADSQSDRKASVPVTLTLKGEPQSYEFVVDLDAASPQ
jgi:DsbC/DsbD-like thiol-disulfide interchange protein